MRNKYIQKYLLYILIFIGFLSLLNFVSSQWHTRWDLTNDGRYTLSEKTLDILDKIQSPITIEVLLQGDIPQEFKKLQVETLQLLEEYQTNSSKIHFNFINPLSDSPNINQTLNQLRTMGLTPIQVNSVEQGKTSQEVIFPWAIVSSGKKSENVQLLQNKLGATDQERVQFSVQKLEYLLTDALYKLFLKKTKKIAVLRSNGTLEDVYIADFIKKMGDYYRIAPFSLDSASVRPQKVLEELKPFNLLIVAKPTQPFSDVQKEIMDQYIMHGGRVLWLIDQVSVSIKDLYESGGKTMAMPLDLNLGDMFFSYGFRINYTLVNDLYFTQLVIAEGEGNQTRYTPIPWVYNPMILSKNNHLITNHLDGIRLQFSNGIDTLSNEVKKEVLLSSSELSKKEGTPREIRLKMNVNELDKSSYQQGNIPVSVLLEGKFPSMYKDRLAPVKITEMLKMSQFTKMIVVSDGDIIKNDLNRGVPLELGYDKWTNNFYDNKAFLQNCVNYLLDENDFLVLRNKKVQLSFLNKQKIINERKRWEIWSILVPLLFVGIMAMMIIIRYRTQYKK